MNRRVAVHIFHFFLRSFLRLATDPLIYDYEKCKAINCTINERRRRGEWMSQVSE